MNHQGIFALYNITVIQYNTTKTYNYWGKCHSFRAKGFASTEIFEGIAEALKEDGANLVKKVKGIFGFKVKANGKEVLWIVDAKNGSGKVEFNGSGKFKFGNNSYTQYFL